jgi:hypothetical protein
MGNLQSLKEFDDFQKYKEFIKTFILTNQDLYRLIYFPIKNPLDEKFEIPENPYQIFDPDSAVEEDGKTGVHGVVLFKEKNDTILNASIPVILVNFETARLGNSYFCDSVYTIFRIITKGTYIQELEDDEGNTVDRSYAIAKLISDEYGLANISKIGEIHRKSLTKIPINEENGGYTIIFEGKGWSNHLSENKNYLKRKYGAE